jgi:cyclic nucleotide gated channel
MRVKRRDTEQWMKHRQLPREIVERVRRFDQYKWVATRGVDEEVLVQSLPLDLRRDIKRHLCLDLVRRVPLFDQMDDSLLDAMCERLKPALNTEGTYIVREGDPVNEMLFIIRGKLESATTNGGRTGFLNVGNLGPGDFCGEELLTWALDPKPSSNLPTSTRTVKALVEVEAFALFAEDLKFVAGQFRRLHSKQLQHTFRYYSHQWRTWAACFVQAAWRRYCRRKIAELRRKEEDLNLQAAIAGADAMLTRPSLGATLKAHRFASNAMQGVQRLRTMHAAEMTRISNIPKPTEPDFSLE